MHTILSLRPEHPLCQLVFRIEAGVDIICLETFPVLQELELLVERSLRYGIPVVALYTFQPDGRGAEGQSPRAVAQRLIEAGADVIGSNCGGGPELIYQVTQPMVELGHPVLAQANAGRPELIEGRSIYIANHEFFSVYARRLLKAGIKLIGGCCGTTPLHIRKMSNATRMLAKASVSVENSTQDTEVKDTEIKSTSQVQAERDTSRLIPLEQRSPLGQRLARGEFVTSVELNPPLGFDLTRKIEAARRLQEAGVTTINIADGPRASARMSNLAMANKVISELLRG